MPSLNLVWALSGDELLKVTNLRFAYSRSIARKASEAGRIYAPRADWDPLGVARHLIAVFQGGLLLVRVTGDRKALRTSLVYQVRVIVCNPAGELRLGMPVTVRMPDPPGAPAVRSGELCAGEHPR